MTDFFMYGFFFAYAGLLFTVYQAYGKRIYNKLMHGQYYAHYEIMDTGENGDFLFKDGLNYLNGIPRVFKLELLQHGVIRYDHDNVEPVKIGNETIKAAKPININRDAGNLKGGSYKYWCDTRNFATITKNDVLETLLILKAKDLIVMFIIGVGILVLLGAIANGYLSYTFHNDISSQLEALKQTAQNNGTILINKGHNP